MKPLLILLAALAVLPACGGEAPPAAANQAAMAAQQQAGGYAGYPAVADPVSAPAAAAAPQGEVEPGIPRLAAAGPSAEALVPKDWRLEHKVQGDLNGDGIDDLVLVMQADYDENLITSGSDDTAVTIDANPRILAFALGGPGGYRMLGQNHKLIPRRESWTMDDPLQDPPVIRNGVTVLTLKLFMSAGGGDMGDYIYRFRVQDGGVRLIGYDHNNVHRMTGETHDTSVNLLTLKRIDKTGNIGARRQKTYNTGVATGPIPLELLGDGFSFEEDQLTG